jgi:hypothetical protein
LFVVDASCLSGINYYMRPNFPRKQFGWAVFSE